MIADADTELPSLDWLLLGDEPLLSSASVGMGVGVEVDPQAERDNAKTTTMIKYTFFILSL
jgi:hypothetical protein